MGDTARQGDDRRTVNRRQVLGRLGVLAAGLTAVACTPLRIVMHIYPEDFDQQPELVDRILGAFARTVIPGVEGAAARVVRAYHDPTFPLGSFTSFLAADLCRRSAACYGTDAFDRLGLTERTRLVQDVLAEGGTAARLYGGAVFLAQVAFYGGIYDDDEGCPAIGFEGRYRFRGIDATTYPEPERFLARQLTRDGNPV